MADISHMPEKTTDEQVWVIITRNGCNNYNEHQAHTEGGGGVASGAFAPPPLSKANFFFDSKVYFFFIPVNLMSLMITCEIAWFLNFV